MTGKYENRCVIDMTGVWVRREEDDMRESYYWKPWDPPELKEEKDTNQRKTTIDGVEYEVVEKNEDGTVTLVRVDEIDPLAREMADTYGKLEVEFCTGVPMSPGYLWSVLDAERRNVWREFARKYAPDGESDNLPDIKLGWKVCRDAGNGYYTSALPNSRHSMIYRTRKWTSRKQGWGPITLFNSCEDAADFGREFLLASKGGWYIVRVAYTKSRERGVWTGKDSRAQVKVPDGTVFADAVYLLDEVWEQPKPKPAISGKKLDKIAEWLHDSGHFTNNERLCEVAGYHGHSAKKRADFRQEVYNTLCAEEEV